MGDTEDGGVRGLRAWVVDAEERVRRMHPAVGGVAPSARECEASVGELEELTRLLEYDPELRSVAAGSLGAALADLIASVNPAGEPVVDRMRQTLNRLLGAVDGAPAPAQTPTPVPDPATPRTAPTRNPPDPDPDPSPEPAPDPSEFLTPDALHRLAAALDAVGAARYGLQDALNGEDPHGAINELLGRLRAVQDRPPPGPDQSAGLEALRAMLLGISAAAGGTYQDQAAGRHHRAATFGHLGELADLLPPGAGDPGVLDRVRELYGRIMDAGQTGDTDADVRVALGLLAEAETLAEDVPDGAFRGFVLATLGAAHGKLGVVTRDPEAALRAMASMKEGMAAVRASGLPFGDLIPMPRFPDFDLLQAALAGDPTVPLPEHVPPPPRSSTEEVYGSARELGLRYGLSPDGEVLDRLIAELERVRDGVREGRAPRIAAEALWSLAEAYRERGVRNEDVSDLSALAAATEALTALSADVLLQSGAEHGLLAARDGASRGLQGALWAASQGRLHEAVAALELGRALVLQATSTALAVPELLERRGHHELADAWRTATGTPDDGAAGGGGVPGGVPGELPSTLRRRALEALGYRHEGALVRTPTLSELADGLAEGGADALLYLVPGDSVSPGVVIVVGPELGAGLWICEPLSRAGSGPLERYLDATAGHDAAVRAAARDGDAVDPGARQTWEDALGGLCDWAHEVLDPVLAGITERLGAERPGAERPGPGARQLRFVVVPCGRLGIVPWHAARSPGEPPRAYLCQSAVVSYAASGSQFLRTLRRAPRPPAAEPVLVADPGQSLMYAEIEVLALRDSFYPGARLCGAISEPGVDATAPCTPEAVLGYLADGASLLHVASHGTAGTSPTASALDLTVPGHASRPDRDPRAPGPDPAPGLLTVTRLLDRPDAGHGPGDGPLVVLSACQTDLSMRDHDEALTLTTGFVTAGARDVVGSRWAAPDGASALLMAVFHHYLNVDRLSPVDALGAAQRWMLDPDRRNPGSLHGDLLREMDRPGLDRIASWAAFVHQGHPGAGPGARAGVDATGDGVENDEAAGRAGAAEKTVREGGEA
ncbi:CHAT domain-containing protein [Streptomyces sp. BE20]|uniref:CHAT domain-containing protein n=1 Tax=Streptomyces sp. BE20 TaxID=3002525 RepID=UPI002E761760|nr:CHAT domain-containing protein [Streptomyces sp. BE20]MEE1824019.1 CHAT domain-containing protein [Streptomyces sp. BE20]